MRADLYTGFIDKNKTFDTKGIKIHSFDIRGGPQLIRNIRISKKFEKSEFPKYDIYIFSGVWCISAAKNCHPNILYLHTPMRAIYDLKDYYLQRSNPATRVAMKRFAGYWTPKDKKFMTNFDLIGANSENVRKRVLRFYGREIYNKTRVVYTGIETKKYRYIKSGEFYLSAARLDPLKRIDMLIHAFKKMPDKKLVVSGTGPDEKRLKKLAAGCLNIRFLGVVSDDELLRLYGMCKATIAANVDEDLGLIAIESHAAGKPIVAIKEGGFLETVDKNNGVFFTGEKDIPTAISRLEKIKWNPKSIQKSAAKYDISVFASKIRSLIKEIY